MSDERRGRFTVLTTGIHHINDPACQGHSRPCIGCKDFCYIDNSTDAELKGSFDLYEAFGSYECQGRHLVCQTTEWFVTASYWRPHANGHTVGWTFSGGGQSLDEAIANTWQAIDDWEANYAAKLLAISPHGDE